MKPYTVEEAIVVANEIHSHLYSSVEGITKALKDLKEKLPDDFRIKNIRVQRFSSDTENNLFSVRFDFKKIKRKIIISRDPYPSDPFADEDIMRPLELVSFPNYLYSKSSGSIDHEKCHNGDELIEALWNESHSEDADDRLDELFDEYFAQIDQDERKRLFDKYLNSHDNCEETRDEFIAKSVEDQASDLASKLWYDANASFYAYSKLMEEAKEDWLIVPVMYCERSEGCNLSPEESSYYSLSSRCDAAFIARKKQFAKERFNDDWNDDKHLRKALEQIQNDIESYNRYLSGDIWWVQSYEDGEEIDNVGDIDGDIDNVLEYLRTDFFEDPKFAELANKGKFEPDSDGYRIY